MNLQSYQQLGSNIKMMIAVECTYKFLSNVHNLLMRKPVYNVIIDKAWSY